MDRRGFLQATAASYLFANFQAERVSAPAEVNQEDGTLAVTQPGYRWEWSESADRFRILDQHGNTITQGPLQPAVVVQQIGAGGKRRCSPGKLESRQVQRGSVVWNYSGVNGSGELTVAWRFDDRGIWIEPATYQTPEREDVVSLSPFGTGKGKVAQPSLETAALVLPGICESEAISPISPADLNWNLRTSLGRTGSGVMQQWGLPAHFFCGFRRRPPYEIEASSPLARAFCCGLAELPNSDIFVEQRGTRGSLTFDYRGDLWGHLRGPGKFILGAALRVSIAPNYYEAIREYYRTLIAAGIVRKKTNSQQKNAALLTPQWCTWGEQVAVQRQGSRLNQESLEEFYRQLKTSGLRAGMFSIDDKWEGKYGNLQHSTERFPRFEQFLDRVRADGHRIGMWAAFMRCEDPSDLGLTSEQMLQRADGSPFVVNAGSAKYYILDFTRPEVEKVISEVARRFVRRYKPDLVKFDFGYEIPTLDSVAPYDKHWAGERMLAKGLGVVVGAMRQEKPDIVVMYYELSPLFTDYFDLHSPDDLFEARGEYDLEANRRFFFSGLCGEFGMPTYGSSGYDWVSQPQIWFDSVAIGTLGCLGSFGGHLEEGNRPTPRLLAKYNGLTHLIRPANQFSIRPLDAVYEAATRGAHASSWAREEEGKVVLVALRPCGLNGGKGSGEWGGVVRTNAQVAVASLTRDDLEHASKLGIVPYGTGELTINMASKVQTSVVVTDHYFGGTSSSRRLDAKNGVLILPLREESDSGSPLEWIEVDIPG